jgi:hypothetical protein
MPGQVAPLPAEAQRLQRELELHQARPEAEESGTMALVALEPMVAPSRTIAAPQAEFPQEPGQAEPAARKLLAGN